MNRQLRIEMVDDLGEGIAREAEYKDQGFGAGATGGMLGVRWYVDCRTGIEHCLASVNLHVPLAADDIIGFFGFVGDDNRSLCTHRDTLQCQKCFVVNPNRDMSSLLPGVASNVKNAL